MRKTTAVVCLVFGFSGAMLAQDPARAVDALNGALRRFAGESGEAKEAPAAGTDLRETAARRATALAALIAADPRRALELALDQTTLAKLRALAAGLPLEEHGNWAGHAQIAYEDAENFRQGRRVRRLEALGETLDLFLALPEPKGFETGALITTGGIRLGGRVAVARASVIGPPRAASCSTVGEQRTAILVLSFPGQPAIDTSPDQIRDYFFSSTNPSVDGFWREASYGKTWAGGDVFGPFTLDRAYGCSEPSTMLYAAIRAADPSVDFRNYTRIFLLFPRPTPACEWAGQGIVGCSGRSSDDGTFSASVTWVAVPPRMSRGWAVEVMAHEGGHNLGLGHSMSRDFGAEPLGAPDTAGTLDEYGDMVAMMGSGIGHYAAQHKRQLGWLADDEVATITDTGEQTLVPLGSQGPGIKALRVRRSPDITGDLWIEYHQPVGPYESAMYTDQVYTGAVIRYDDVKTIYRDTHLLDFTPQSEDAEYDFMDPALASGGFWFDPYSPRTLYITGATGKELRVRAGLEAGCVTLGAPGREHGPEAASGSIAITGAADCAWQAVASEAWITVQPASGSGGATLDYRVAANPGGTARKGAITVGRQVFTITQRGAPVPPVTYGAYPKSGRGPYAELALGFGDPNGLDDLAVLRVSIGGKNNGCFLEYDVAAKSFRLANDAGTGWIGPETETSFHPLENSQCKVIDAASYDYADELVLLYGIVFKAAAKLDLKVLISAVDKAGLEAPWEEAAAWTALPNVKPALSGVVPAGGAGTDLVFHITATDANGPADVQKAVLRVGAAPRMCEVTVYPQLMVAALTMDDGSQQADLYGFRGTLENSQCVLNLGDGDTYESGNEIRVRIPLRFKDAFAGTYALSAAVADYSAAGAQMEAGRWTVGPPTVAAPAITAAGVVNAASFAGGAVAPGELVTIFGTGAGPAELQASWYEGQNLRAMVANTEVFFDWYRAPLIHTSSGQVSAVVPYSVRDKTTLRVEYEGRRSNPVELAVAACAPGVFTVRGGAGPVVAANQDGSLNSADNPAERGSVISIYTTGEGATKPSIATGRLPAAGSWPAPVEPVKVTFGGVEGRIEFIGLVYSGVTQVNVRVPAEAPAGAAPLLVTMGGAASLAGVTVQLR